MDQQVEAQVARLHDVDGAFGRIGVSRAKGYQLISNGTLRSVKIGRRRLVPESAIFEFIEYLEAGGAC
jgi:excisionase family DNA binding protein